MTFVRQWNLLCTNPSYTEIILDYKKRQQQQTDIIIWANKGEECRGHYTFNTANMPGVSRVDQIFIS